MVAMMTNDGPTNNPPIIFQVADYCPTDEKDSYSSQQHIKTKFKKVKIKDEFLVGRGGDEF